MLGKFGHQRGLDQEVRRLRVGATPRHCGMRDADGTTIAKK
jgi:hypothetical protein